MPFKILAHKTDDVLLVQEIKEKLEDIKFNLQKALDYEDDWIKDLNYLEKRLNELECKNVNAFKDAVSSFLTYSVIEKPQVFVWFSRILLNTGIDPPVTLKTFPSLTLNKDSFSFDFPKYLLEGRHSYAQNK